MLQKLGLKEGEAIVHSWVNKALEKAQEKVEARNFEIRRNILKFDNVMNDQRKVVYEQRKELMRTPDVSQTVADMRHEVIAGLVTRTAPKGSYAEQWEVKQLHEECLRLLGLDLPLADWAKEEGLDEEGLEERIRAASDKRYAEREARFTAPVMRLAEKSILLQFLDQIWKDHLLGLDHLRHGITFRAYGQRDPLTEYRREAFDMFEAMLARVRETVTGILNHIEIRVNTPEELAAQQARRAQAPRRMQETRSDPALAPAGADAAPPPVRRPQPAMPAAPAAGAAVLRQPAAKPEPLAPQSNWGKVPRNAPCPCGSGKKFKQCHGKV
jgi:preprotein translocase subunit SecA